MARISAWKLFLFTFIGVALVASTGRAESLSPGAKLPDPVMKTFKATFPMAEIEKIDVLEEEGVMVYDIEFKDGKTEKETDIAADGTMLEHTLVIQSKAIPAAPMKAIKEASKGAKLGRLERIEISYETKDGQVVKLPSMITRYAAEMTKKNQQAEIIVGADGTVAEAPNWVPKNAPAKSAAK